MFGDIDGGGDTDILTAQFAPTEVWEFRISGGDGGSLLSPHLAVAEHGNVSPFTPNWVAIGPVDGGAVLEVFVHRGSRHNIFVRDARNVGTGGTFGGPAFHWKLEVERQTRSPTGVAAPGSLVATLSGRNALGLHGFTLGTSTALDLEVLAGGDLDPQLGLYDVSRATYVRTNDDRQTGVRNPLLTGVLQPGSYLLVVNNVSPTATTFGYTVQITAN